MSMDLNLLPPLTRRERELITLIGRGLQNKIIAHELNISEHTVRAHIGNIMRKYRLQNRTQIAVTLAVTSSLYPFGDEGAA
jgi:DNA-binding NarL/FixJ family response regulator